MALIASTDLEGRAIWECDECRRGVSQKTSFEVPHLRNCRSKATRASLETSSKVENVAVEVVKASATTTVRTAYGCDIEIDSEELRKLKKGHTWADIKSGNFDY